MGFVGEPNPLPEAGNSIFLVEVTVLVAEKSILLSNFDLVWLLVSFCTCSIRMAL
jgi:hypothetical protein